MYNNKKILFIYFIIIMSNKRKASEIDDSKPLNKFNYNGGFVTLPDYINPEIFNVNSDTIKEIVEDEDIPLIINTICIAMHQLQHQNKPLESSSIKLTVLAGNVSKCGPEDYFINLTMPEGEYLLNFNGMVDIKKTFPSRILHLETGVDKTKRFYLLIKIGSIRCSDMFTDNIINTTIWVIESKNTNIEHFFDTSDTSQTKFQAGNNIKRKRPNPK